MILSPKDYEERLLEYYKQQGPNPAETFMGALGWYAKKRKEFNELLKEKKMNKMENSCEKTF